MIFLIVAVILIAAYVVIYNNLVYAKNMVKEAFSGIDVQLKRRYELIPNLVKTVQAYAKHESEVFENVIKARSTAIEVSDGKVADQAHAENLLSGTLKSLFAVTENYPDLKANENFLKLQEDLTETEDQIAASRRIYNSNVTSYNIKVESFPLNIIANIQHFEVAEFFKVNDSTERSNITVKI